MRIDRARYIAGETNRIARKYRKADPDNIRHTLILLQMPPFERLRRALARGTKRQGGCLPER
ncbi:MAG: hypothetical protein R6V03_04505 [Kiritimatiellia bacterium]